MTEENKKVQTPLIERLAKGRGDEIRIAREAKGWSQAELAQKAGTTQQTVDRIERGVTEHSRSYPSLRVALELPPLEGYNLEKTERMLESLQRASEKSFEKWEAERRHRPLSDFQPHNQSSEADFIPLFATSGLFEDYRLSQRPIDSIRRGYPVERVDGAFGVISTEDAMSPVIRPGDIAIINPNLPAIVGGEALLSNGDGDTWSGILRTLVGDDGENWILQTWTPKPVQLKIPKSHYKRVEMVVSKIARIR